MARASSSGQGKAPVSLTSLFVRSAIDGPDSCWRFQGAHWHDGYGYVHDRGVKRAVHVVAYERLVGPVPPGLDLDHECRTRDCWNPLHLTPLTHRQNVLLAKRPHLRTKTKLRRTGR